MEKKEIKIYAILVLYNKHYQDSLTFKSILGKGVDVIICDNSTKNYNNDSCKHVSTVSYINMGGNSGLSKAYNKAIDFIGKQDCYICLFDDDTKVPEDYFEEVKKVIVEQKADVYLPVVYDEVGLLSPNIMKKYSCKRAKSLECLNQDISGINSGMVINAKIFSEYRYNENLFLDFVDHNFIKDIKNQGGLIRIMKNIVLNQKFSANSVDEESVKHRYQILKKDIKVFYSFSWKAKIYYYYLISKRKIKLCIKFNSIEYLFI